MAGASWRSPPSLAAAVGWRCGQRRLVLVEREPLGDDDVIAAPELVDKAGVERHAAVPSEMGGMTGAAEQALHPARPFFLLDVDQRLEFAPVMGVAQGMQHPFHLVVGFPVVMHDDAHNVRQQAAALGRDAIEGQPHGAGDVQPLRPAADPEAGLSPPALPEGPSRCLTAAALTSAPTVSANPWTRPAQVRLIRAMVAATSRTGRPSPRPAGPRAEAGSGAGRPRPPRSAGRTAPAP